MAHVTVALNPGAETISRYSANIQRVKPPQVLQRASTVVKRTYGQQGLPYLARFINASAFPGLGTRAYGYLSG